MTDTFRPRDPETLPLDHDLLRWIPVDAKRVLEVGRRAGALAEAFALKHPGAEYVGLVEEGPVTGSVSGYTRLVIHADGPGGDLKKLGVKPKTVDALVLTHVYPAGDIKRLASLLAPGGAVIVAVPNLSYWAYVREILRGRLVVSEGHSQPLSRSGVQQWFEQAGLKVADMKAGSEAQTKRAEADSFLTALKPALDHAGINPQVFAAEANAARFIARGGVEAVKPMLLHAMMLQPVAAVNDVRIIQPCDAVGSFPGVRVVLETGHVTTGRASLAEDRVFIAHRPIHRYAKPELLKWLVKNDYVIVTEFDDHPMRWPEIEQNNYLSFIAAHGVQTSTEPLGEYFRTHNPEVKVFPNAIAALPPLPEKPAGPVRLFFGALNREEDWAPLLPALNEVLAKAGDAHIDIVHDQKLFDALETERKTFTPTCGHGEYLALLAKADIALLPLEDNLFNRMKSDLKWLEAAATGAVALASPVVYDSVIRHSKTGMMFKTPKEFREQLETLIRDRKLRHKIRAQAYEEVKAKRLLSAQARTRYEWYRSLLARKAELTEGLKTRVPELFEG